MTRQLYNILVPIDFRARNRWAIQKAVELSNGFGCNIHLLHIGKTNSTKERSKEQTQKKLEQLKNKFSRHISGPGKIEVNVVYGNHSEQLVNYVQQHEMDLIITGLSRFSILQRLISSVSISRLSQKIQIPILAVRASGMVCQYKKIVLPVGAELPIRQIRLAAMLGRAFKSTVYFVSLRRTHMGDTSILSQALEVVQSISTVPVQTILLEGKNLAKSTLDFSKKINADLIMVNPIRDFQLPGWWNRVTNKLLSYASHIPVLTVSREK